MNAGIDDETAPEDLQAYLDQAPDHGIFQQAKTDFQRWHHPRKQYVRIHQWCAGVRQLIRELGLGNGDPFRYLTLPGNELLDVRALQGVCQPLGVQLRYLGFNSVQRGGSDQAELNISRSEVQALAGIDRFSLVLEDRLEAVANDRSPAFGTARQHGPFHAINIDLCDSIAFRDVDDPRGSILGVVAKLLELQLQTAEPWLLFITTMAQPGLISQRSRQGFDAAISANTAASDVFREEMAQLVSGSAEELDARLEQAWAGQDPDFLRLFCAGLGKWLLALLVDAAPPRELVLLSSCYYQVGPDGPDMLSLAFRCNTPRQPVADRHGILPAAQPTKPFSEVEVAIDLARKLSASIDLDQMLAGDQPLAEKLITQAGRLLATARFREDAYQDWARAELARGHGAA